MGPAYTQWIQMVILQLIFPFQYREPYIGSPGLRHAILSSIPLARFNDSGTYIRFRSPRYAYHNQHAKQYLQRKLARPEELVDADLFTAIWLSMDASSIKEIEVHMAGVGALLTWLQNRAKANCPLSNYRYMIWELAVSNILSICTDENIIYYDLLATHHWTQGGRTRARLNYLQQLDSTKLTTFLVHQLHSCVVLHQNVQLQRRTGRPLSNIRLQSILEDSESWIQVMESPEITHIFFDHAPNFGQEVGEMTLGRLSGPSLHELELRLHFNALVIYTRVARKVQGLLSVKVNSAMARLHNDLLYLQIFKHCGSRPRCLCMYTR